MTGSSSRRNITAQARALQQILVIAAKAVAPNPPQPAVETLTPGPMMDAIVNGATPLRAWRQHRQLTPT